MSKSFIYTKLSVAVATIMLSSLIHASDDNINAGKEIRLESIVSTASGFEQDIKDAPASISVITKEDIEKKNATTIADLLTEVPGVDVRNGVGKTGNLDVGIRGLPAKYTLILIDGKRQGASSDIAPNGFDDALHAFLPPLASIERIEVIRGPMSTIYGSDAMGGVINIITKKVSPEWHGNVRISGNVMEDKQEANSGNISFSTSGPLINDKLGLQLRGSFMDRGKSERIDGTTGRSPRPGKAHNYDVGAKLDYLFDEQNSFWVEGSKSKQVYKNIDSMLGEIDTPTLISGYSADGELTFNRDQFTIGHEGHYSFGKWVTYINQSNTEAKGRTIPRAFPTVALRGKDRELESKDLIINSTINQQVANHNLTGGLEYNEIKVKEGLVPGETFKNNTVAGFIEDEWRLIDTLALTLGGRYEHHDQFGGHFNPRAYLVWNATEDISLKGGVSTGYKTPTPLQLNDGINGVGSQGRTISIGNPNLKPEKSTNYELGFYFNRDSLDFSTTVFYSKIKDLITEGDALYNCNSKDNPNRPGCVVYGTTTQDTFSQNVNANEAETKGVEVALKYTIIPEWDIKTAYTWMETEITKGDVSGASYNNVPKNSVNTTSTWHLTDNLDMYLQHEYKSDKKRFLTAPTDAESLKVMQLTDNKVSGYNVFNLGASYRLTDAIRINGAVNNLLNKNFAEVVGEVDNQTVYKYIQIGRSIDGTYIAGRNYWLSVSYDF